MKAEAPTGFVLAGGHSTRLGQDKVLLPWQGSTLLEDALSKLRIVCDQVYICTNRQELGKYAPAIPDGVGSANADNAIGPIGPLGGIVAALEATATEWNCFLPVDLPLLPVRLLEEMLDRARCESGYAVIPLWAGRQQPLCAIYHRDLLPGLRVSMMEGKYKVMLALEEAAKAAGSLRKQEGVFEVQKFIEMYAVPSEMGADWFLNINTPEALRQARHKVAQNPLSLRTGK